MGVLIPQALLLRIMREVRIGSLIDGRPGAPAEKCGILRGRGEHVVRAERTRNVARDPFTHFEIDPAALIRAHKLARSPNGLAILGFYHTHPTGDCMPSPEDARCAAPDGKLWLIACAAGARLWRAVPSGAHLGRFDPVAFDMMVGKRVDEGVGGIAWRGSGRGHRFELVAEPSHLGSPAP